MKNESRLANYCIALYVRLQVAENQSIRSSDGRQSRIGTNELLIDCQIAAVRASTRGQFDKSAASI